MGKPTSSLADTVAEAVRLRAAQKAAGASDAECDRYLEGVLRQSWPFTREWKYLCDKCDDTGLVMGDCSGDATCGRASIHGRHSFGTPCWCSAGNRFKAKPKTEDDFSQATAKTRKPTRFGR